jgi:hypothetical protein
MKGMLQGAFLIAGTAYFLAEATRAVIMLAIWYWA